ncbi:MAG: DUF1926 domain-containing protein [Acidobacteria bacterium]|nr:DUF1926 domain-containing protein [Acidobacteriota bacterium]
MNPISLLLILHAHQPIGNFDHVLEQCYRRAYLPFLECLERHPGICVNLHYSGPLWEWLEQGHPEYLESLRRLRESGRIEMLGGGFYEPILITIPEADRQAQLARMREFLENRFGETPRGIWLTERIWEPALPETLARAGVQYTLVDDTHFLAAGLEPDELYGYHLTESDGHWVAIVPGLKRLRYLIPWKPVREVMETLAQAANSHPNSMMAMGDDLEKFGSWPQTYRSVYEEGWLENFFTEIESNGSWLQSRRASDYLNGHAPLGTVYMPTASYREMTEWCLPNKASEMYEQTVRHLENLEHSEEYLRFVNAGTWRNFLSKYSESNLLHKQMLALSERFSRCQSAAPAAQWKAAYGHLLAAQCNDAYWHGVFGGLYSPHLRHALYSRLIQAEAALEAIDGTFASAPVCERELGLLGQKRTELEVSAPRVNLLIHPTDGATVGAIHYKPARANLVNSLRRRPEVYHKKLAAAVTTPPTGPAKSIHEVTLAKEEGLGQWLRYDRYERNVFRAYLFDAKRTLEDFAALHLQESREWAAAPYQMARAGLWNWTFARQGALTLDGVSIELLLEKQIQLEVQAEKDRLRCLLSLKRLQGEGRFRLGLELVLNLLAGHAPDRYYAAGDWKEHLDWQGEKTLAGPLTLHDDWLQVNIELNATPVAAHWWLCPIFTVSQSEEGIERVYQGSSILSVWDVDLAASGSWEGEVEMVLRTTA